MARLSTCKVSALSAETQLALDAVKLNGKLADVYLQFANSEPALLAYLTMESALQRSSLTLEEVECVKLLVSELTQCHYCLSVHSVKSRAAGLDKSTQIAIRRGDTLENERMNVLCNLVRKLVTTPGTLAQAELDNARSVGFSDQSLVDICLTVSTIFFTNITNHINDSDLPFPAAPDIQPNQS